ncbi:unnamed protein product [Discosporangium mesarthrocarpum]
MRPLVVQYKGNTWTNPTPHPLPLLPFHSPSHSPFPILRGRCLASLGGGGFHDKGMDRLAGMLMRLYFVSPADTAENVVDEEGCLILEGQRVFCMFSGLFQRFGLWDLYVPERGGVLVCTEVLQLLTKKRLPKLVDHFNKIDFSVDMVAMGWFQTLFVYLHAMPRRTVRRIWDWWLCSGDFEVFFRVSMALLQLSEEILLSLDFDATIHYFNSFPHSDILSPEVLLREAESITVHQGELMTLELEVRQKEDLEVYPLTQLMLRPCLSKQRESESAA